MDIISKTLMLSPDLPYFQGHFPDFPVLPAVAFLKLSQAIIETSISQKLILVEASSWRFKQPLPPNREVHFAAIPKDSPALPSSNESLPSPDSLTLENNTRSVSYKVSWSFSSSSEAPYISEGLMRFQFS